MNDMGRPTSKDYSNVNLSSLIGRLYEQVNCWQLVREFYMKIYGIELSQYHGPVTPDAEKTAELITTNRGDFARVEEPRFGDLMLLRILGMECHIGIFIGKGKFLHSLKGTGSVLDSFEKYKSRVVGYYRHRGLTE